MAIYGRTGDKVTIVRRGTLDDVKKLDGRKPDKQDREAVKSRSYVVVRRDDGAEQLYHLAYLRADGGSREITDTIDALAPHVSADGVCDECEAMPDGRDGRADFCRYHRVHATVPS